MSIPSTTPTLYESLCDDPSTHLHTLDSPKSACSPNCVRVIYTLKPQLPLSWLKNTSLQPFIWPVCVEEAASYDYDALLAHHRERGGRFVNDKEANICIWTYAAIKAMVDEGGRICEGMSGCFSMTAVNAYGVFADEGVTAVLRNTIYELERLEVWEMREQKKSGGEAEAEIDEDDASGMALFRARFQSELEAAREDIGDLAERMRDARIGFKYEDVDMDELVHGIDSM
ncbi:hypothetical protein EK21DRAFT_101510 [Setomelanomma holmii]|uniref:Uncharacterized protein n=1 Tax=Setomelanomma holmii TaxID=210430 RepID=A0A9P4H669_9PLEO|nr:hypothetical protein EK21DRAFT_101510 [Setomelanomma holmii]